MNHSYVVVHFEEALKKRASSQWLLIFKNFSRKEKFLHDWFSGV